MTDSIDIKSQTSFAESYDLLHDNLRLPELTYLPLDKLSLPSRRLKRHPEELIVGIMASIRAFGPVVPILIDMKGIIIDGEAAYEAAKRLGLRRVPTLTLEHLDDNQIRVLRLALKNLARKATFDENELALEFQELVVLDLDMPLGVTGFSDIEIDGYLLDSNEPSVDDESPVVDIQPEAAVSRVGDKWILGKHVLVNGSSLEEATFQALMGKQLARMAISDLPYNVKIAHNVSGLGKNKHREFIQGSGELSKQQFRDFQIGSVRLHSQFCCDGSLQFYYMDWRGGAGMYEAIEAAGLELKNVIVWKKSNAGMGSLYRSQTEFVFLGKKGDTPHVNNVQLGKFGRHRTNCWEYPGMNTFSADRDELLAMHSTVKNLNMISDAIRDVSHRGDIVLDGFGGSGTTLIAAEKTGRMCRMIELDPLYVDCIIRRWEKYTGLFARLATPEAPTFAEVASRRLAEAASVTAENVRHEIQARPRVRRAA